MKNNSVSFYGFYVFTLNRQLAIDGFQSDVIKL